MTATICLFVVAAGACEAAFIITSGHHDGAGARALVVPTSGQAARAVLPGGELQAVDLPCDISPRAGCFAPELGYLVFAEYGAWSLADHTWGAWTRLSGMPAGVTQAAAVGSGLLALLIDTPDGNSVELYGIESPHTLVHVHTGVKPASRPQWLKPGILDEGAHLLVGVLTVAIFDPVLHLRPWLYHVDDGRLVPVWLGTSFSRPFSAAVFADVVDAGADEVCSLERTADGQRLITAYGLHGFVMEGVAQSRAMELGDSLSAARMPQSADVVCAWVGGRTGHVGAFAADGRVPDGVASMAEIAMTPTVMRPAAWDIIVDQGELRAVMVDAAAAATCVPMADIGVDAVARGDDSAL